MLGLILLPVQGGGHADMLSEDPVELGEAIKAAGGRDLGDWDLGVDQQGLHIPDPRHLNVVRDGKARYLLEPVGQIAGADAEFPGEKIKGKVLRVMGVDIAGHGIDLPLHFRHLGLVGIDVAALIQEKQDQKLDKFLVNDEIAHGILLRRKLVYVVQLAVKPFLKLGIEAENGNIPVEYAQ